ncbi:unnamed protein product [Leuciscus chuanchicus]
MRLRAGIVRVEQKNNTLLEMGLFDDGPYEVGDENRLDPRFSLDSGHSITEKGKLIIVSGAPRANHSGAVVFLRKQEEASTMLMSEHILEGPGLASSFGYDVAVVDLNGDGSGTVHRSHVSVHTSVQTSRFGIVRVEQKNNTLLEMGLFDDGPYEVGDENRLDPSLVPVPANSYLAWEEEP